MRIDDAAAAFLADRKRRDCLPTTMNYYGQQVRYLCTWLAGQGVERCEDLRPEHAAGYAEYLRGRAMSPVTVRKWCTATRTFFLWAQRAGAVAEPLARHVLVPRARQRLPKALSVEQASRLIGALDGARDVAIVYLLLDTGLRLSEVCALNAGDVDLAGCTALVRHGKGDKERLVVFSETARQALAEWMRMREPMNCKGIDALFISRTNERLTDSGLYKLISRAGRNASVHVSPHMLRHSFATLYLERGGQIHDLSDLLGHEHIATTMIYNHTAIATLRRKHGAFSPLDAVKGCHEQHPEQLSVPE